MRLTNALGVISLTFSLVASREIPTHDSKVVLSLQQTLALYLLAIDSKSFVALDQVLAQDVVANYSAPLGVLNGLLTVESVLQTSLAPVLTQHSLSTFSVTELNTESASTVSLKAPLKYESKGFDRKIRLHIILRIILGRGLTTVRFITHMVNTLINGRW